jgi:hypothetical protein
VLTPILKEHNRDSYIKQRETERLEQRKRSEKTSISSLNVRELMTNARAELDSNKLDS